MKKNWDVNNLGYVLDVMKNGINCIQNKTGQGNKISRIETISQANIDLSKVGYCLLNESDMGKYKIEQGDILFSHINSPPHVGKSAIYNSTEELYHGVNLLLMRPRNILLPMYLEYFLKFLYLSGFWKRLCKQSVNQASVNQQDINKVLIKYPKILSEQQHIVDIIEEAFAAIAIAKENTEKNLQNAREVFESYLQRVFANPCDDWEEKTLNQISKTFGRGKSRHRPRNDKTLYNGKYPFIQTGDIRNANHYISEYTQTYNEIGLAQSKLWPKGTICITIAANIAETGVLSFDACFPDSVIGLVLNNELADTNFVEYLLQSFKTKLQAKGKGSAQANINLATFENELFPIPVLFEQQQIVAKLDTLSDETKKLEAIYLQKLANLEVLKKSILQKAFNGEL